MSVHETNETLGAMLLGPQMFSNPYPIYEAMRPLGPVFWDDTFHAWLVTGYNEASALFRDPRFSSARYPSEEQLEAWGIQHLMPLFGIARKMMLLQDPPDHTRLRGLVSKAFTPRAIDNMRAQIQSLVDEMLAPGLQRGEIDVIKELAVPLPTVVIATMLGVPREDRDQLKKWSTDFALFIGKFDLSIEEYAQLQESMLEFSDYFRARLAEVRMQPREDLLSALSHAEEQGDKLTEDEVLANCILLLAAGHETTTNLIGNGTLALLRNPGQKEKLQADPTLIGSAVEELLRYDSPVQFTSRVPLEPVELSGKRIGAGQEVLIAIGAANRDPARFPNPDRLDIARADNRHLSFIVGPHFCLGAPLARLEGQVALGNLFSRAPNLRLATKELSWQENHILHGLKSLPVVF